MIKFKQHVLSSAAFVMFAAASALGMPEICKQLPENAAVVITLPNPNKASKNFADFTTAIEAPIPPTGVEEYLGILGITDGLNLDKAMAIVLLAPSDPKAEFDPKDEDRVVFLVPTSNYKAMVESAGAKATAGIDQTQTMMGDDVFFKNLNNGYAAMAPKKTGIENFALGKKDVITGLVGAAGNKLLDESDLAVIVNVEALRPIAASTIQRLKEQAKNKIENNPAMAQAGGEMVEIFDSPLMKWFEEMATKDTRAAVVGLKLKPTGVAVDGSVSFVTGTLLHKMFSAKYDSHALLQNLPAGPYMIAGASDVSSPAYKEFTKTYLAKAEASMPKNAAMPKDIFRMDPSVIDGQAMSFNLSLEAMMTGGMFNSALMYVQSATPEKAVAEFEKQLTKMNGFENEKVTLATGYTSNGETLGENKIAVDLYEITAESQSKDPMVAMQMGQMFGPEGKLQGYIAKTGSGYYVTFARNAELLETALDAAKSGNNLSADEGLKQVAEYLPGNRTMEGYLAPKPILDMVGPMAMLLTGTPLPEDLIPETLPPLGMSMAANDGCAHFSLFAPMPVVKTAIKIGQTITSAREEMMGEDGMYEEDTTDNSDENEDKPHKPTGQPKF